MLDPDHFMILAGQDVVDSLRDARQQFVTVDGGDLLDHQSRLHDQGYRGAEIYGTAANGYIVRYDSALQDSAVLFRADTLTEILRWCRQWQQLDPAHRYVWKRR